MNSHDDSLVPSTPPINKSSIPSRSIADFKERFTIGRTLGSGEFAIVKAAISKESNEKVAIKLIRQGSTDHRRDQLRKELGILKRISHKNIPQIHEIIQLDSKIAVVMEYGGRGELFHKVQQAGRLDSRVAALYFIQLLSAVDYLHTIGIVHRDIKLGYDGYAADVWSLGVVLYGMLCGCLPYDDEQHRRLQQAEYSRQISNGEREQNVTDNNPPINVRTLYNYIASSPLQFPTDQVIDILAVDLLRAILQPNPLKRITIAEIWSHPWLTHA